MSSLIVRLQHELARLRPPDILIIEPDSNLSGLLSEHLQQYETHVVSNGRDALRYCHETPPNLILLDATLPDMPALDLFQQLLPLKFSNRIPVFLLGQRADQRNQRMQALEMGVDDYINKPFDIVELQFRVKNALPNPAQTVDLVTNLPGWPATHLELKRRLKQADWSLIYFHIAYMAAYHDLHGTIAGQQIRRTIADLLNDIVDDRGQLADFIGAIGESEFVIITGSERPSRMTTQFQQRFYHECRQWYTPREMAAERVKLPDGAFTPIMTPMTAVVPSQLKTFSTTLEVLQTAENLRLKNHPNTQPQRLSPPLKAIFAAS